MMTPKGDLLLEALWSRAAEQFRPPPRLTLSEWADLHFYLPPDKGGKWKSRAYQRGILDAFTDPEIERVTLMKSSRVGYTSMLQADFAYHVAQDPCGILDVQPTVEDAEGYSKDNIASTIEHNECLRGLISDVKSRASDNTILQKAFPGGRWWGVGANSGRGFRRIGPRRARCDEIDAFPPSAGTEGDPVELAWRRTQDAVFGRKLILGSTPLEKGTSRIEAAFEESDQRRFFVSCPHCQHEQFLRWGGRDKDFGIKWPKDSPRDAYYLCERCHSTISESRKEELVEGGTWIPTAKPRVEAWVGFHIWAAYSLDPNVSWGKIAEEHVAVADDHTRLKTWVNQVLGETWEDRGKSLNSHWLAARRERFPTVGGEPVVPAAAAVLTAAIDVQDDRLELFVTAWGEGEECWALEYYVLPGDPSSKRVWEDADAILIAPRVHELGPEMFIRGWGVDTGGHHTDEAYAFANPRMRRKMPDGAWQLGFALKGSKIAKDPVWPPAASRKVKKGKLWNIGVNAAKDTLQKRLRITQKGPGYFHCPKPLKVAFEFCTIEWFEQLTAEKKVQKTDRGRFPYEVWELIKSGSRNEAWDTLVYNYAVLHGLVFFRVRIERELERLRRQAAGMPAPVIDAPEDGDEIEVSVPESPESDEPAPPRRAVAAPRPVPKARRGWGAARLDYFRR